MASNIVLGGGDAKTSPETAQDNIPFPTNPVNEIHLILVSFMIIITLPYKVDDHLTAIKMISNLNFYFPYSFS